MSNVAIITARGGSKRIPRKNIKDFCGKPIIAYSINAALRSSVFDEIMVSTDDEEIADVARRYGASVPFMRSDATSDDFATTTAVLREVLASYKTLGVTFDEICCIYPTAPFICTQELIEAWRMIEQGASSVIPVTSFDYPPQRGFDLLPDGGVRYSHPEYAATRSQDLAPMVHDCGRFYMAKTELYLSKGSFLMRGCRSLYIDPMRAQDIDTIEDWKLAEFKFRLMQEGEI